MKKTLKNITAYIVLAMVLLSSGSFQMHFMHCSKTNLTKISPMMSIRTQEIKHIDEESECTKCRQENTCSAGNCAETASTNDANIVKVKDACCINYLVLYKNDLTSEAPIKITSPEIEFPTLILHKGFNNFKSIEKIKYNLTDFADISPHPIIKQIIKSILQKSIQSPDEAVC